ncbi:PEP-CTERM sorting domain-containing protein [Tropicibacter sp. S64]|uniref:PEP-CTERM sorting domain-containing protein n=1 Tax=Tropicibacter sp. S64 TaxID=3415122 RepID=UPI003C7DBD47
MTAALRLATAACLLALAAPAAEAATVGFGLTVSTSGSGGDRPQFTLTNISDSALIQTFTFAINAPGYWFDYIYSQTVPVTPVGQTLTTGQTNGNENSGTTSVAFGFTAFDPSDVFQFRADLDPIGVADAATNFRSVFFNNGGPSVPNATASVLFSDGRTLALELSGTGGQSAYIYTAAIVDAPVPLPATLPLALVGLGGLGLMARRRKAA